MKKMFFFRNKIVDTIIFFFSPTNCKGRVRFITKLFFANKRGCQESGFERVEDYFYFLLYCYSEYENRIMYITYFLL